MNQLCRVCGEPAAGFHFGAFTCEGCKSFFGRTYNNLSQIHECKNGGSCIINKQNRTSCKACRLKKCLVVGMSKSGSRYGRRSNWFKIHCLLQEQAAQVNKSLDPNGNQQMSLGSPTLMSLSPSVMTSLSPPMTSLSPVRNEDESKLESSALSSPESIGSECSFDIHRKGLISQPSMMGRRDIPDFGPLTRDSILRDGVPAGDFVANLGLYSLHPGLSLLHASQFYSRFYPSVLYPALTHPHLIATPPTPPTAPRSPPFSHSSPDVTVSYKSVPFFPSRPRSSSPVTGFRGISTNPYSLKSPFPRPKSPIFPSAPHTGKPGSPEHLGPKSSVPPVPLSSSMKRGAQEMEDQEGGSSTTSQDAPIDLTMKRKKIKTKNEDKLPLAPPTPPPPPPTSPSTSHSSPPNAPIVTMLPVPPVISATPVVPVNLTQA